VGLVAVPTAEGSRTSLPIEPEAWTSYGYDNQLTNSIVTRALTLRSTPRLSPMWSTQLDGPVYASPLAAKADGRLLVFAATEAGSVYAVDSASGKVVWQRSLGAVQTAVCGKWGITSTGAIDLERGLLYEISADGLLHALALATGNEAAGYPITLITNNRYEYAWGGLRIANERLYAVVASYCDVGPPGGSMPEGRMFAVPLSSPAMLSSWDPVPGDGNMGGIWGWGGVSIDPSDGRVFTGVGNSSVRFDACGCVIDNAGYGDSIVALTPDISTVLDSDNPPTVPSTDDSDFGAAPLLFQPTACPLLAAMNNKDGFSLRLGSDPTLRGAALAHSARRRRCGLRRRAFVVGGEADGLRRAVRDPRRWRDVGERRDRLARRSRLRLSSDLEREVRDREPGDAACGRQCPLRDRREDRRVLCG
jgi:PQQ-like domain